MTLPVMTALPGERRGYVDGPDGQIHYRSLGEGEPIVLVHMAPWSSIAFRHAMPVLAEAGYRAIAIDLPAHGMSSPPESPSIETYAEATAALIEALELGSAIVLGHRGGSLVAGRLAATRPELVKALVFDNVPYMSAEMRAERVGRFPDDQSLNADGSHIQNRWDWVKRVGDKDWSDETVHIAVVTYFLHGPWKEHGHSVIPLYDFEADEPKIACPVLIIAGKSDAVYPSAARLSSARPEWPLVELPGGPGMITDRIEEWKAPVLAFLTEL